MTKLKDENYFIDSAESLLKKLKDDEEIESSLTEVRSVMKKDLKMSYKKVKIVAELANSPKNLVLR